MDRINQYFPTLTKHQLDQFEHAKNAYNEWNKAINVVSRKDIDEMEVRHFLHSLAIAKLINFKPKTKVLDIGTGGGFPGIPLAIVFPEVQFTLVDSIGKKITVVDEVCKAAGIHNVVGIHARAESISGQFDFIVSRAVTAFSQFIPWTKGRFLKTNNNSMHNGILYLKGGDLDQEIADAKLKVDSFSIPSFFREPFFETKKVIYVSAGLNRL